ncbi:MAG: hypothetical protein KDA59_17050, partial [Planctomycetales bacterium]|nr:hypothetical protein [Planctomycetales bacterium]
RDESSRLTNYLGRNSFGQKPASYVSLWRGIPFVIRTTRRPLTSCLFLFVFMQQLARSRSISYRESNDPCRRARGVFACVLRVLPSPSSP